MGGDHDGVVGKRDMKGRGGRTFIGVGGSYGEEMAGGAGVKAGGREVGLQGGT
jgi:hypothetical protein